MVGGREWGMVGGSGGRCEGVEWRRREWGRKGASGVEREGGGGKNREGRWLPDSMVVSERKEGAWEKGRREG